MRKLWNEDKTVPQILFPGFQHLDFSSFIASKLQAQSRDTALVGSTPPPHRRPSSLPRPLTSSWDLMFLGG